MFTYEVSIRMFNCEILSLCLQQEVGKLMTQQHNIHTAEFENLKRAKREVLIQYKALKTDTFTHEHKQSMLNSKEPSMY